MAADAAGPDGFSGAMEGNGHFERAASAEGALPVLSSVARFLASHICFAAIKVQVVPAAQGNSSTIN
jgi:hypothetical protein